LGDVLVERHPVGADQRLEPRRVERLYLDLSQSSPVCHGHQTVTSARATSDATSSAHAPIACQSRASEAGIRLKGKRSFAGSITPPKTAAVVGSTAPSARSSCARDSARSCADAVFGPSAKT